MVRPLYSNSPIPNIDNDIFALDSTTISLSINLFRWVEGKKSKKLYPQILRMVEYYDDDKDVLLVFLTNNLEVSALEVARLYRNRWQIEVFFKWIKQNLIIKKLWGQYENAVKIHIWVAICTYLIVAYVKYSVKSTLSIYEIMQILGISAFDNQF